MIETLTEEQNKLMDIVKNEWINFCLGGDTSIDRKKAKEGIDWIYSLNKLPSPKFIAFAEGPLAAQYIANVFPDVCKAMKIKLNIDSVRDSVWASVGASVRASVKASVKASVGDSVRDSVWDSVKASVWASVGDSVGDSVSANMRANCKKYEYPLWALSDSGWIAFYDYFMRIGLKHKIFEKYRDWLMAGHWECLLFKNLAIVVCRPSLIKKNSKGQLHCENGPAAEWPSGEKYWFFNGTRANEKIIMHSDELTKEEILSEKNSEVSRVIAEKLGWDEYLKRIDSVLVDKWFDCNTSCHYELYDFKERRFPLMPRLLKMESPELNDGTRPYYIEPIDPRIKTCQAARKWQIPKKDGTWPTVKECNDNPELIFEYEY